MSVPVAAPPALWRVAAAGVRGAAHARAGSPCQDAHAWAAAGDALLLAVADGAGSASASDAGARAAACAAVAALASGWTPDAAGSEPLRARLDGALRAARGALERAAAARGLPPAELATTLIVAAVLPGRVAAAQVGDGAAVALDAADGPVALTRPARGEFANETVFLTGAGAVDGAQRTVREGEVRGVALFTDGVEGLALRLADGAPHAPFFDPLFRFAAAEADPREARGRLAAFLAGPRVAARTDDDRTLLLAVRAGGGDAR